MGGLDVGSQVMFVLKAFVTHCTRKGLGRGRVDKVDVGGEVKLPSKALATTCMWTREGGPGGGVNSGDVFGEVRFPFVAFATEVRAGEERPSG